MRTGRWWRHGAAVTPPPGTPAEGPREDTALDEESLTALLAEVHELRRTLSTDLAAAAGAAEAGRPDIVRDIVEADRMELGGFSRRASWLVGRARAGAAPRAGAPTWRRRVALSLPAVPLVGAMALSAAAATGALPLPGASHQQVAPVQRPAETVAAADTFREFADVVDGDPTASQVLAAARQLHQQLAALLAVDPGNPTRATEIAHLLQLEQDLLLRRQPPGTSAALAASRRLVAQLMQVAPAAVLPTLRAAATPTLSYSPSGGQRHHSPTATPTSPSSGPGAFFSPSPSSSGTPSPSPTTSPTATPAPTDSPNNGLPPFGGSKGQLGYAH